MALPHRTCRGFGRVERSAYRARTYGDIRTGQVGLVVDSYGLVSVCLDRQPASRELSIGAGTAVTISAAD